MKFLNVLLMSVLSLGTFTANAREIGIVDGLQAPAWLVRDGRSSALAVGTQLQNNDRIETGKKARVLLSLAEGSHVKLGENATFDLNNMEPNAADSTFKGVLNVLKGAFRFTTGLLEKQTLKRQIDVRFGTITAGIRGTDIWGIVDDKKDLVALIEGKIDVSHSNGMTAHFTEPLQVFTANKNEAPGVITKVDAPTVTTLAKETDFVDNTGVMRANGAWRVNMGFYKQKSDAEKAQTKYQSLGYDVKLAKRDATGARRYQIYLDHFATEAEAKGAKNGLIENFGLEVARVVKS